MPKLWFVYVEQDEMVRRAFERWYKKDFASLQDKIETRISGDPNQTLEVLQRAASERLIEKLIVVTGGDLGDMDGLEFLACLVLLGRRMGFAVHQCAIFSGNDRCRASAQLMSWAFFLKPEMGSLREWISIAFTGIALPQPRILP